MFKAPLKLIGRVQHYPWGRAASRSRIAQFAPPAVDRSLPFAECWFGAHPTASSILSIEGSDVPLDQLIRQHPTALLGAEIAQRYGQLPFLFKVLSIDRPLSIQAHPDKALALKLHQRDPKHYPDPNHKPEVAVALSTVELLYGFRPQIMISSLLNEVPELTLLVDQPTTLRELYGQLMRADADLIETASQRLFARLLNQGKRSAVEDWILRLADQFPKGDVGLFSFFLLNHFTLREGEAIFTEPNVPHAYLSGELLECMAASDNVLRGGLTDKYCDRETLVQMLSYEGKNIVPLAPSQLAGSVEGWRFVTPAAEFEISLYAGPALAPEKSTETGRPNVGSLSTEGRVELVFCESGGGAIEGDFGTVNLKAGDAFLIPAAVSDYVLSISGGKLVRIRIPKTQ